MSARVIERMHKLNVGGWVKSYLIGIFVFFLVTSPVASAADDLIAPDWTLSTPEGRAVRLSEKVEHQTTVLLFWATWCPYCKALMPHLQSMRFEYGDEVEILAINIFEDGDPLEFLQKEGYDFVLLPDGDDVADTYGVTGTPGLIVVGRDRVVHFDLRGLPPLANKTLAGPASNSRKAALLAPYWAAEIRKVVDSVLQDYQ
jgi:cytochrome c biogenesis protein CcmG/thiol:disulfide interchange protein DsbE